MISNVNIHKTTIIYSFHINDLFFLVGECAFWQIIVIPLLTAKFFEVDLLQKIVKTVITDCKWYNDDIKLHLLTNNFSLIDIHNPLELYELEKNVS